MKVTITLPEPGGFKVRWWRKLVRERIQELLNGSGFKTTVVFSEATSGQKLRALGLTPSHIDGELAANLATQIANILADLSRFTPVYVCISDTRLSRDAEVK